jgi:hypothetical protein
MNAATTSVSTDTFTNYAAELRLDELDGIEAPMSNDFWTGFFLGFGAVLAVVGLIMIL